MNPKLVALFAIAIMSSIVFSLYDQYICKEEISSDCNIWSGFTKYGALTSKNWDNNRLTAFFVFTYATWALALGLLCFYLFSGRGGILNRVLSHSVFIPLARLTYNVYLVHIPVIQYMYATSPSPLIVSKKVHFIDTLGATLASFFLSFLLYLLIERPIVNVTAILLKRRVNKQVIIENATEIRQPLLEG